MLMRSTLNITPSKIAQENEKRLHCTKEKETFLAYSKKLGIQVSCGRDLQSNGVFFGCYTQSSYGL